MNYKREGEIIHLALAHEDSDGKVMFDLQASWYGFDNAKANDVLLGLIQAISDYTRKLSEIKNA